MSRYAILIEDENLEVFVGFDEGFGKFFLTIEDVRTCTGEAGSYIVHNMDDHPGVGMTLREVAGTLLKFGITLPQDLAEQLVRDAQQGGAEPRVFGMLRLVPADPATPGHKGEQPWPSGSPTRIVGWQSAL